VATAQATGGSGSDTLTAIENLTGSAYADTLTGSTAANTLDGGAGADTLTGGLGADRLTGGSDADTFRFVTTGEGSDTIYDFASGTDKIYIVAANFGLTAGSAANLVINGAPSTAARAFVYNSTTGTLGFDSDGNGIATATQLATLSNKPAGFNSNDFVIGA
jgi:Ca2+-binding RTX toxin-like protein